MTFARTTLGALALTFAFAQGLNAQAVEKKDVSLGVGGKGLLYYLPLTLAEQLGHFKEQGLNVTISDFAGGSKSLQALIGGSIDVVAGAYEHTIRMQAKGQDIKAIVELGRFPGMVLAVKKEHQAKVKTFGDLKGMKVGVTAPGSSTNFLLNALLAKDGLKPTDVSIIGVGAGPSAVAAIKKGDIDALVNPDTVISKLPPAGDVYILADARTEEGNMKLFGGNNPAAVLYAKTDFIEKNPVTVQKLVNATCSSNSTPNCAPPRSIWPRRSMPGSSRRRRACSSGGDAFSDLGDLGSMRANAARATLPRSYCRERCAAVSAWKWRHEHPVDPVARRPWLCRQLRRRAGLAAHGLQRVAHSHR
ncbi:MAG: ABC transporter substrate-binding protein [Proteobacteria bacterium]|nr:ABC transporter substrate-binding protein [Pseudomonadota bacterium]